MTINNCSIKIGFTRLYQLNVHNPTICNKIHNAHFSPLSFAHHPYNDMSAIFFFFFFFFFISILKKEMFRNV